ncbi:hypothetical protein Psyaliredsea_26750 [Psychrobacter alimentarius]
MLIKKLSKLIAMMMTFTLITSCSDLFSANYIGDLGGVPVDLPKNFVHLVEYDGDPAWGKKREGPQPTRSYDSKINSFGFDVRYTDNTILDKSNKSLKRAYDEEKTYRIVLGYRSESPLEINIMKRAQFIVSAMERFILAQQQVLFMNMDSLITINTD